MIVKNKCKHVQERKNDCLSSALKMLIWSRRETKRRWNLGLISVFMPHGGKNTKKPLSFTKATFVPAVIRESVCVFLL